MIAQLMLDTGLSEADLLATSDETWEALIDVLNQRAERAAAQQEEQERQQMAADMRAKYGGRRG